MFECVGEAVSVASEPVTGRLRSVGSGCAGRVTVATILIWNGKCELDEATLAEAVGVVFPEGLRGECRRSLALITRFLKIPALCVSIADVERLERVETRVAILVSMCGKLYVDPDLNIIGRYFSARPSLVAHSPEFLIKGRGKNDTVCDGYVVGDELLEDADEETAYDFFCEVADENMGARFVAVVPFVKDTERVKSRIRAVYRAGVWGRFSLLCTHVNGRDEADRCLSLLHTAFSELDREGREFNGFIPKGITVRTPIMLLTPPRHRYFDLFCLDYTALMRGFTGREDGGKDAGQVIEYMKRFADGAGNAKISIIANGDIPPLLLNYGIISDIYVDGGEKYGGKQKTNI